MKASTALLALCAGLAAAAPATRSRRDLPLDGWDDDEGLIERPFAPPTSSNSEGGTTWSPTKEEPQYINSNPGQYLDDPDDDSVKPTNDPDDRRDEWDAKAIGDGVPLSDHPSHKLSNEEERAKMMHLDDD
ncbi:hypothetical protein CDD83_10236 [Cordyceps sp. RAO-2017]|nr:hypothetical protein CDD83_10236 [Cordyceps sp. RAO-2017]